MAAVEEIFPAVRRPPETYRGAEFQTQPRVTCGRTSLGYPLQKQVEEGIISVWCRFPCCAEWVVTRTGPLGAPTPGGLPLYVSRLIVLRFNGNCKGLCEKGASGAHIIEGIRRPLFIFPLDFFLPWGYTVVEQVR